MFMQPLSIRHSCCHQQMPSHQMRQDNYENQGGPMSAPSTSSVCLSQCTDNTIKSSLPSSTLSVKIEEHTKHKQTPNACEQLKRPHSNDLINLNECCGNHSATIATKLHTATVQFIDSTTTSNSEQSSLSLLFEQTTHNNDPLRRSNHVMTIAHTHISIYLIHSNDFTRLMI